MEPKCSTRRCHIRCIIVHFFPRFSKIDGPRTKNYIVNLICCKKKKKRPGGRGGGGSGDGTLLDITSTIVSGTGAVCCWSPVVSPSGLLPWGRRLFFVSFTDILTRVSSVVSNKQNTRKTTKIRWVQFRDWFWFGNSLNSIGSRFLENRV